VSTRETTSDVAVAPTQAANGELATGDTHVGPPETARTSTSGDAPVPGSQIGELIVLRLLGTGGMGTVVAAYDPRLDRQVAVKLLKGVALRATEGREGQARLVREAQAMAKLSHPNVVPVFAVGETGDDVYLVMELVHGSTLRKWLAETKRSWRQIIDVFIAAGRGLAAAHHAGLVHRDFKPENVLVGLDGRVRVTDFGVAGTARGEAAVQKPAPASIALRAEGTAPTAVGWSTVTGGLIVGTPEYMAPEQLAGKSVDERADQFAYAASLWEALYGELPFSATVTERVLAAGVVELRQPRRDVAVPATIRRAVVRGLATEPSGRFPSMEAFLAAITLRQRPWRVAAALGVGALVAASGAIYAMRDHTNEPCPSPQAKLAGVWDSATRANIEAAFTATKLPYASASLATTRSALDAYSNEWLEQRVEACRATEVRHEQSPHLLDLRIACLDRRLDDLRALVEVLAKAENSIVDRAADAAFRLPALAGCADPDALSAMPMPSDLRIAAQIGAVRSRLAQASALENIGKLTDAFAIVEPAATEAASIDWAPLTGEALDARGRLERSLGRNEPALASFTLAMKAATKAGDESRVVATIAGIVNAEVTLDRLKEADGVAPVLAALADRAHDPLAATRAWSMLAFLAHQDGNSKKAVELQSKAIAMLPPRFGTSPRLASMLGNLGSYRKDDSDFEGALSAYNESVAIYERALGGQHPDLAQTLSGMAGLEMNLERYDAARPLWERALAIRVANLPPTHSVISVTRAFLAEAVLLAGDPAHAVDVANQALAGARASHDDGAVAFALGVLGRGQAANGKPREAEAALREAVKIFVDAKQTSDSDARRLQLHLARFLLDQGRFAEARPILEEAAPALEADTREPTKVVDAALALGDLARARGDRAVAKQHYERAAANARKLLGADHPRVARAEARIRDL
jgi:serine/threonine protein kinase/tetratricopeptide (TPR) repeat protein